MSVGVQLLVGDGGGGGDVEVGGLAGGSGVAGEGDGLAGADPQVDGPSGNAAIALGVNYGEFAGSEGEGDSLRSMGVEVDALEAGECADGSAFDVGMRDVEFDDFVAGDRGGVGDAAGDDNRGVARGSCGRIM